MIRATSGRIAAACASDDDAEALDYLDDVMAELEIEASLERAHFGPDF